MVTLIDHAFPDIEESRGRYIEEFPETAEEVLDSNGLIKLWLMIKRKHLSSFAEEKKINITEETAPSFKPEITPKSKKLAKKELDKYLKGNKLDNLK